MSMEKSPKDPLPDQSDVMGYSSHWNHGSFDGRRYQVWLFPPPLPILQGPTQVQSACQVQFLRGNFFLQ